MKLTRVVIDADGSEWVEYCRDRFLDIARQHEGHLREHTMCDTRIRVVPGSPWWHWCLPLSWLGKFSPTLPVETQYVVERCQRKAWR